jgi:hypothetical protein
MEVINIQTEDGRLLTGNWIRATGALPVRGTPLSHCMIEHQSQVANFPEYG